MISLNGIFVSLGYGTNQMLSTVFSYNL